MKIIKLLNEGFKHVNEPHQFILFGIFASMQLVYSFQFEITIFFYNNNMKLMIQFVFIIVFYFIFIQISDRFSGLIIAHNKSESFLFQSQIRNKIILGLSF